MEINKILQANILDLIFDGRNKDYGAYELRKNYNKRVIIALGIVLGSIACFIVFNIVHANNKVSNHPVIDPTVTFTSVNTKPIDIKKEKPKEKPHQKTAMKKISKDPVKLEVKQYTKPKIVPDNLFDVNKNVKKVDDLVNSKVGSFEQKGLKGDIVAPVLKIDGPGGNVFGSPDPSDHGGGNGNSEGSNEIAKNVQQEAQYPTGKQGWSNYLHRSLRSDVPTENGAPTGHNYTVLVSFVVDVDGTISNVVAENDPGYGTAAEAVRAIRNSGKWIPAMQNGRKVKYRQRQQITFQVTEE
ncbi:MULTISPECIES: energy transducer TonB [Chitinophagaceae]